MVDVGISSTDAEVIAAEYQTIAIPDTDKKLLAYVKKVTSHAYNTPTPIWMRSRGANCRKERSSKSDSGCGIVQRYQLMGQCAEFCYEDNG
jgi:hypothetical protein